MIGSTGLKEHRGSSPGEASEPHQPPARRFADVSSGHPNEEDIYLVVHRGVIRGTSANTYGPLQAVTREEVALSLIRLAALVGIEVPPAGDARFSDIGQLPYESRAAIDQLTTHLEISHGTSATTFSPSQAVTRGQMALFLQRLMNRIPLLQKRGGTPADVIHKTQVSEAGTPFTDLGMVTVATFNAIVQLHLLGVASGISSTAYAPSALITRATMAGLIARVLEVVERERDDEISSRSRRSDPASAVPAGNNRRSAAHLFDRYDPDPLDEEAERIAKEGPRGPHDTAFYVPHQQEDRLVEFDLLTATVDDIISRCGYSEDERSELAEAHRRMAEHDLRFYRGPLPESIPLLEGTR